MGAGISSTVGLGVGYCFCNACSKVCDSLLGNTSASTTGRKRSVLLLTIAIIMAFFFQYKLGPAIVTQTGFLWKLYRLIPGMGKLVYSGWRTSCEQYAPSEENAADIQSQDLLNICAGNAGVYRAMFLATAFFTIHAVATYLVPHIQKEVWPAKYTIYMFLLLFSVFFPTDPIFGQYFLWIARMGATAFVLFQQIILIDVAYNWNENWVERSNESDREVYGSGVHWLRAIVAMCVLLYATVVTGIVLLFQNFGGCADNNWIIAMSVVAVLIMTSMQLVGREGSLLTSAVMCLYILYLAFMMVSKNPNPICNPRLGENDAWGVSIGLFLTTISLVWTGWSWTAEERLSNVESLSSTGAVMASQPNSGGSGGGGNSSSSVGIDLDVPFLDPSDRAPTGIVTDNGGGAEDRSGNPDIWKLNVIMALICCWVAMTLTGWGLIEEVIVDENTGSIRAANPTAGHVNMAMIGISQWLSVILYVWTMLAPVLFPDRDFS